MLRIVVIALVAANLLLLVLEASKGPRVKEPVAESAPPSSLDPRLPGIQLLSELSDDGIGATQFSNCFTVGPFETVELLEQARAGLAGLVETVSSRQTEAVVERGYWVYLPPFGTFEEALGMARTMRAAGITDVNALRDGDWGNSLSLGYFVNETNATARRDQIRNQGFDAQTRIQRDTEPRYWLDYEQLTGSQYAAQVLSDSIAPGLHRSIPCVSVSPTDEVVAQ
jgi:hypothetical protein